MGMDIDMEQEVDRFKNKYYRYNPRKILETFHNESGEWATSYYDIYEDALVMNPSTLVKYEDTWAEPFRGMEDGTS